MELLNNTTDLIGLKDPNIKITFVLKHNTHIEIKAKLDYKPSLCPRCQGQMAKYDFQKASKIPLLDIQGMPTLLRLKKRRFRCRDCRKITVAETPLVEKNCQISLPVRQKIAQRLIENTAMKDIARDLSVSTSTVIRKLKEFTFKPDFSSLPEVLSWDEFSFKKGRMSFVAQDYHTRQLIAILDGRTQATIRNYFLRYPRKVRASVKWITMDMFAPYYDLARKLFPNAQIVLDRFHIVQHLNRAMNRTRIQIMNEMDRKQLPYKAIKRYWKLIQQDSRKLNNKRFYRPTFRDHLTNQEIIEKLLSYSDELKEYYNLYQLLLFHFQEKRSDLFFDLIEDTFETVNPIFQSVFKTFIKVKTKIINAFEQPYSNAKLEATNNLIKVIKRNAFGFRNFEHFKTRSCIALNIKIERTNLILSRS
ncbi:ISL3 family transposase [Streptococcus merionis]|nr:ISL3 family transposase [Streptococcus merionis]